MIGFYILASLVIIQGLVALLEGVRYWRFVRESLASPPADYTPKVAILAPCKGIDPGFRDSVWSLLGQDYPDYEVIFVTESRVDPAYRLLSEGIPNPKHQAPNQFQIPSTKLQTNSKSQAPNPKPMEFGIWNLEFPAKRAKLVEAGPAHAQGQKVHNLLRALDHVSPDVEVLAFIDSDATAPGGWLRHLVAPLWDPEVGATTGYRWYIPAKGNGWSHLRSLWNASIATALGPHKRNFAWGGSTAIRREVFDAAGVRDAWAGACTEDYPLSRAVKDHGLYVKFVPQCLIPSRGGCALRELLQFTTRQAILTRVYSPRLWLLALLTNLMFFGAFYGGLALLLGQWVNGEMSQWGNESMSQGVNAAMRQWTISPFPHFPILLLVGLIYGLGVAKAVLRQKAVELILSPSGEIPNSKFQISNKSEIPQANDQNALPNVWDLGFGAWDFPAGVARYRFQYYFLYPLATLLWLYNLAVSAVSRQLEWRGIRYKLVSPTETVILRRSADGRGERGEEIKK